MIHMASGFWTRFRACLGSGFRGLRGSSAGGQVENTTRNMIGQQVYLENFLHCPVIHICSSGFGVTRPAGFQDLGVAIFLDSSRLHHPAWDIGHMSAAPFERSKSLDAST